MEIDKIVKTLHPLERRILPYLEKSSDVSEIIKLSGMEKVEVLRAAQWLQAKGVLKVEEKIEEVIEVGENGKKYLKEKLPERRFLESLTEKMTIEDITKKAKLTIEETNACIGLLKKKGMINFSNGILYLTEDGKRILKSEFPEEKFLKSLPKKISELNDDEKKILSELQKRKEIIEKKVIKSFYIKPLPLAKQISSIKIKDYVDTITPDLIKEKSWKNKEFRRYDINQKPPRDYPARSHPMSCIIEMIREIFTEMGFQEMEGPWVETAFWCMDSMWIPQDHPAREIQDTFYLPYKGNLPDKKIVDKVIACHENGGKSGSKGYGYKWNPELAKQLLLRTHTTATTFRYLGLKNIKAPAKYFYIGRIFRNEAIDATHLSEFHQVEGFVVGEGLGLKHLMGVIKEFYAKMGIHKIRFKPTYNPYTEPSMEALYYDEKRKKWIELINSGIFRPEALEPYGIKQPVIAWGLGLERLAMILHERENLREMIGPTVDFDWIKTYKMIYRKD